MEINAANVKLFCAKPSFVDKTMDEKKIKFGELSTKEILSKRLNPGVSIVRIV